MDRQSQLDGYFKKGIEETARKALTEGLPIDIIRKITGLSPEEITKL